MIKLRDHYFISWLKIVKGYSVKIDTSGIYVNINNTKYQEALKEYEATHKPVFVEIKKFVKELAALSPNSSNE